MGRKMRTLRRERDSWKEGGWGEGEGGWEMGGGGRGKGG